MRPRLTPAQWLLLLLLVGIGAYGWIYGLGWKRVASGADTTHQERLLIDLQDQITELRQENDRLVALLREKVGEAKEEPSSPTEAEPLGKTKSPLPMPQ